MTVPQRVLDTMNSGLIYTCDDEEMIDRGSRTGW